MIIAVSDVHIGYSESDSMDFGRFLADDLWKDNNISDLVLCGDIFDMWRGAIVDVMLEGSGIVRGLKHLNWKYGINITFIAGNHDYLIRNSRVAPFKFNTFKILEEGGVKYTFIHGWEDDSIQNRSFFDALCYTDNRTGALLDDAWQNYLRHRSYLTRLWESLFGLKSREQMRMMTKPPGERDLGWLFGLKSREQMRMMTKPPGERDLGWLFGSYDQGPTQMTGDVTVMGHTHTPGINGNVANAGSWCSDSPVHDTYIMIDGDTVEIRRYGDD